ncbi:hypothetical protein FHR23_002721 [Stakelama sediminis]|uniref:Uncharacterized protein n=1 Tax=Stakelama sediminis TaxID=463200 RepID=A0A840Z1G3_9SPHN|nr:hypothetical protein [Stakelama sediminis]
MSVRAAIRILSCSGVSWRAQGAEAGTTTGRWRDKKAHGALRSVGCFCLFFRRVPHRVVLSRTVRPAPIFLIFLFLLYRAEFRHGR